MLFLFGSWSSLLAMGNKEVRRTPDFEFDSPTMATTSMFHKIHPVNKSIRITFICRTFSVYIANITKNNHELVLVRDP